MRTTGIVRRIDDLGRIIIPKEIRRQFNIQEGDPLEIFTDPATRSVTFRPYAVQPEIFRTVKNIIAANNPDCKILVAVRGEFVLAYRVSEKFLGAINPALEKAFTENDSTECDFALDFTEKMRIRYKMEISPNSRNYILFLDRVPSNDVLAVMNTVANYLSQQLEI